ncbi:MAG: hypothetical protein S4CHLAM20_05720 [Chlamydiia bacterium]|nr:hypothetical protein [Chlamydiia bacterium]
MKLLYLSLLFISCLFCNLFEYNIAHNFNEADYERPIVVCIPSYNNEDVCIACLDSVFSQKYSNFRVIYVNDASIDDTSNLIEDYIWKNNLSDKIVIINNLKNKGMLSNHILMANLCEDNEIIVSLDGDDKFSSEYSLARINSAYMDSDVWVTYGQFKEEGETYPHKARPFIKYKLHPRIIRKMPFMFMQPRTYYAGLFKQIPKSYFQINNSYYPTAGDVAIMTYLIDLAREHTFFIPEVIYTYNTKNPINDHKVDRELQLEYEKIIKRRKPLEHAEAPF